MNLLKTNIKYDNTIRKVLYWGTKMKFIERHIKVFCWLFMLIVLVTISQVPIAAALAAPTSHVDVILVIDESASMKHSDPHKISIEAMKMFIDMVTVKGDQIGIISYTDKIMREKAILPINSEADKKALKEFADQMTRDGMQTDIAIGLKDAAAMLEKQHKSGNKPMIVLLTDGKNDFKTNSGRTQETAEKDLEEAIGKGFPIYTIGLNADGSVDQAYLKKIADRTAAKSFIATSAKELPSILSNIFADVIQVGVIPVSNLTANGEFQDVKITIPNSSILEANIIMLSNKPVEVQIYDPSGKNRKIPDSDINYSKSSTYSMVKLITPIQGDWNLKVKGITGDQIKINLVYNYDIQIKVDPLQKVQYTKGDTVALKAYLESNGQKISDAAIYNKMKTILLVKDIDDGQENKIAATTQSNGFDVEFKIPDEHKYQLVLRVEGGGFYRESSPIDIDASKQPIKSSTTPTPNENKPEQKEGNSFGLIIAIVAGVLIILAAIYFILLQIKKSNRRFVGQIVLEIEDMNTGKMLSPQYKKLNLYKGKVTLFHLLALNPEFKETEKIIFFPGKEDRLIMKTLNGCEVRKTGRIIDASKGQIIKKDDKLIIILKDTAKNIHIEYIY
ncbi:MAG: vWA domain-containing protein, partial [Ruminiclostridium sp.]